MNKINYGPINSAIMGVTLKEIVRRAMEEIHAQRISFKGQDKVTTFKPGQMDLVTSADFAAQEILVKKLKECFPDYGIVAEEKGLKQPCRLRDETLFFTVDPLDGTKAFGRKQSHGFGPMLSLCGETEVLAALVGDSMTSELYYYRPDSDKVHRLNFKDWQYERLTINEKKPLSQQYVLLRDDPRSLPSEMEKIAGGKEHGGIFQNLEVAGGGIGTWMARLWKGEVGACITNPGTQTPWDLWPIVGISKKLGFKFLYKVGPGRWDIRDTTPSMEPVVWDKSTLIIHESRIEELLDRTKWNLV